MYNLNAMQNGGKLCVFTITTPLDSLNNHLSGPNPVSGFDTLIPSTGLINDSLHYYLTGSGFSTIDSSTILFQFDTLSSIWDIKQDSLLHIFDPNQNGFGNAPNLPTNGFPIGGQPWGLYLDSLKNAQSIGFNSNLAHGLGNFQSLFNTLFNPALFTMLEIYGGQQTSKVNYYGLTYATELPVIGIRSVEQFDRKIEPRWRVQGSWFPKNTTVQSDDKSYTFTKNDPFMFNAGFDIMMNPQFQLGGQAVRVLTLLGIDAAVYAPAHKDSSKPFTLANKGKTTGWGPIVGAGMSTTLGSTTIYALSTYSYGDVVCGRDAVQSDYKYRSFRSEAGIKLANRVTVRYEIGISNNWANNGDKAVRYQQFTVGLPTTALFH